MDFLIMCTYIITLLAGIMLGYFLYKVIVNFSICKNCLKKIMKEENQSTSYFLIEIEQEYFNSNKKFTGFNSYHQGYAVILEELDELWEEIKKDKCNKTERRKRIKSESIQVAAMALKLLIYNERENK